MKKIDCRKTGRACDGRATMLPPVLALAEMALKALFLATLFSAAMLVNSSAWSCIMARPFRLEAIRNAPIIFSGRVIDYLPRSVTGGPATIEFEMIEVYRGDRDDTVRLSWSNETFGIPATWPYAPEVIVAAKPNPYRNRTEPRMVAWAKEHLVVFQESCSVPFFLADTPQIRAKVRALIGQ